MWGLHLIMVMGTDSVEQFFSFCKYADTDERHAMADNARCLAFMAHYNVKVEGPGGGGGGATPRVLGRQLPLPPPHLGGVRPTVICQRCCPQASMGA